MERARRCWASSGARNTFAGAVDNSCRMPVKKIVAADPVVSLAVGTALGKLNPKKASWAGSVRALDAGLDAAVSAQGHGGTEIGVEEALALRQWATKMREPALPYVVGKLALAGVKTHV